MLTGFQNETPIVLKVGLDENALMREADALNVFKNSGAVHILNEKKGAILLERGVPGTSLKSFFPTQDTKNSPYCVRDDETFASSSHTYGA